MRLSEIRADHYRIPLPVALSDSTHGLIEGFELVTVRVRDEDGAEGAGYTYTVGTGGAAVHAVLTRDLAPRLAGREAERDADGDGEGKAEDIAHPAPGEVAPDFAGHEEHAESGLRDERGRGDEDRLELPPLRRIAQQRVQQARPPAALEAFPGDQEQDHHERAEDGALMREVET